MMEIIRELPPIYQEIIEAGMCPNLLTTTFAFGDKLYVPNKDLVVSDHLMCHEELHAEQQGHTEEGALRWWNRYILDTYFRIDQEAKAYAAQYDFICQHHQRDRNRRNIVLNDLGRILASPTYGAALSPTDAKNIIKKNTKTHAMHT